MGAVAAVAMAAYVPTLLPGVGLWDTAEFQTVPAILGVMHATGYPLYTLLGKLASLVPLGSVAYRLNLFSAVCAAVASGLVTSLALRLGTRTGAAVMAGLATAFCLPMWNTAVRADPHTLHALFVPVLVWLLVAWRDDPTPRRLGLLAFGVGLSLANHMQTTMLVPGLAVGALWGRWRAVTPRAIAHALAGAVLGLLPYVYLPWRAAQHPALNYGRPSDWPHFRALVLGEQFHSDMGFFSTSGLQTFLVQAGRLPGWYADWLTYAPALVVAAGGLVGAVVLARRDRGLGVGLAVMAFLPLYWACTWINGDAERYFITPALLVALFAAVGLGGATSALGRRWPRLALGAAALVALVPLLAVPANFARASRANDHQGEKYVDDVFRRLPPDATVFTVWVSSTPLWYAHYVEGRRPDLRIVDDSEIRVDRAGDVLGTVRAELGHRPVYILRPPDDDTSFSAAFALRDLGPDPVFNYQLREVVARR